MFSEIMENFESKHNGNVSTYSNETSIEKFWCKLCKFINSKQKEMNFGKALSKATDIWIYIERGGEGMARILNIYHKIHFEYIIF